MPEAEPIRTKRTAVALRLTRFFVRRLICPSCQCAAGAYPCDVGFFFGFSPRVFRPQEGRFAIVTNVGRKMRWTPVAHQTNARSSGRRSRGVLISRRWYQVGDNADALHPRWWQESPITRETTKETVKTSRAGNAGCVRRPAVTTLVCFLSTHEAAGALKRPAFPAPSVMEGR